MNFLDLVSLDLIQFANRGQLNRDQQFDLLRILLQHLKMFSEGPAMVLIRLCVAIAQAAINLVPKDWPKMFEDLFPLSQPVRSLYY